MSGIPKQYNIEYEWKKWIEVPTFDEATITNLRTLHELWHKAKRKTATWHALYEVARAQCSAQREMERARIADQLKPMTKQQIADKYRFTIRYNTTRWSLVEGVIMLALRDLPDEHGIVKALWAQMTEEEKEGLA